MPEAPVAPIESANHLPTILRWPNSKRSASAMLRRHTPATYNTLYVPGFGSGAALSDLDVEDHPTVLADGNRHVLNLLVAIKGHLADFEAACLAIEKDGALTSKQAYDSLRHEFNHCPTKDGLSFKVRKSALFLWLNHRSFNGLYRENASGLFNVPATPKIAQSGRVFGETLMNKVRQASAWLNRRRLSIIKGGPTAVLANAGPGDWVVLNGTGTDESTRKRVWALWTDLNARGCFVSLLLQPSDWAKRVFPQYEEDNGHFLAFSTRVADVSDGG